MLRNELWSRGIYYRKNVTRIFGKPDLAFVGKKVAVFCDSEFWHGYDWKHASKKIKTNRNYWIPKIERNMEHDKKVNAELEKQGWIVLRFWGKDIKENVSKCADKVEKALKPHKYRAADLFAGIGGIRLGFEEAFGEELQVNITCEIDQKAREMYLANFDTPLDIKEDIQNLDEHTLQNFDICFAGFPCQAFSIAGQRLGFEDYHNGKKRGLLFFEVVRICKEKHPKVIFCENVKGLLSHDGGNTFSTIKKELENIGYNVRYKVLNSHNFGVPQNRERVYIIAFDKRLDITGFEIPESNGSINAVLGDILEDKIVDSKYYLSKKYLNTLYAHRDREKAKNHGFGMIIRDENDIAGALMCGGMGKERNLIHDYKRTVFDEEHVMRGPVNHEYVRKLTPREWARLQGFPEDFKLVVKDTHLYNQFGNTVTIPVIKAIAERIKIILDNNQH